MMAVGVAAKAVVGWEEMGLTVVQGSAGVDSDGADSVAEAAEVAG